MIDDLRKHAADTGLGADKAETVEKVCAYLEIEKPYLDYATARGAAGRSPPASSKASAAT